MISWTVLQSSLLISEAFFANISTMAWDSELKDFYFCFCFWIYIFWFFVVSACEMASMKIGWDENFYNQHFKNEKLNIIQFVFEKILKNQIFLKNFSKKNFQ